MMKCFYFFRVLAYNFFKKIRRMRIWDAVFYLSVILDERSKSTLRKVTSRDFMGLYIYWKKEYIEYLREIFLH